MWISIFVSCETDLSFLAVKKTLFYVKLFFSLLKESGEKCAQKIDNLDKQGFVLEDEFFCKIRIGLMD